MTLPSAVARAAAAGGRRRPGGLETEAADVTEAERGTAMTAKRTEDGRARGAGPLSVRADRQRPRCRREREDTSGADVGRRLEQLGFRWSG